MSTVVASYTPVCLSPVLPAPSGTRSASRSWRPAAAFPAFVAVKCQRSSSVTCALPEKQRPAFSISPTALLYPVPPPDGKERWDIEEVGDHVKLWFQVPGLSEDDLDITVSEDMLEIKRKGAKIGDRDDETLADMHGVGSFQVRLLMTTEYDRANVKAELKAGMLEVTVGKSKQRTVNSVPFGSKSSAKSPDPGTSTGGRSSTATGERSSTATGGSGARSSGSTRNPTQGDASTKRAQGQNNVEDGSR